MLAHDDMPATTCRESAKQQSELFWQISRRSNGRSPLPSERIPENQNEMSRNNISRLETKNKGSYFEPSSEVMPSVFEPSCELVRKSILKRSIT